MNCVISVYSLVYQSNIQKFKGNVNGGEVRGRRVDSTPKCNALVKITQINL